MFDIPESFEWTYQRASYPSVMAENKSEKSFNPATTHDVFTLDFERDDIMAIVDDLYAEIERVRNEHYMVDKIVLGVEEYAALYAATCIERRYSDGYFDTGTPMLAEKLPMGVSDDDIVVIEGSHVEALPDTDPMVQVADYYEDHDAAD